MIRVLFVCEGNICRSPMAEGLFQKLVIDAGLGDHILVDSAGTSAYHVGERAHSGTRAVLKKHNIPYDGRSRQLQRKDFYSYDYVLAMDAYNLSRIRALQPEDAQPVVRLFMDYAPDRTESEVPDPYYSGGFDFVYELVAAGTQGLLAAIREDHAL